MKLWFEKIWRAYILRSIRFVVFWCASRPLWTVAWGILPLVVGGLFLFVTAEGGRISKSDLAARYEAATATEIRKINPEAAELWLRKVAILDDRVTPETRYRQAIAAEQEEDLATARTIMQELAPAEGHGMPVAHYWLANDLIRNKSERSATDDSVIRHHLKQFLEANPDNLSVRSLLADRLLKAQMLEEAIPQLERMTEQDPAHAYSLGRVLAVQGENSRARRVVEEAILRLARSHEDDPADLLIRVSLARMYCFLEDFETGTQLIAEGLQQAVEQRDTEHRDDGTDALIDDPNDSATATPEQQAEVLRGELTLALIGWYEMLARQSPNNFALRLELLQQALALAPDSPQVLERLAQLAAADVRGSDTARAALNDALAAGQATPLVHLLLGIAEYKDGDREQEEHHLRLALAADPRLVIAANNLAWLLAERNPPDLDQAMQLIERAVALQPDHPDLRATRGRIYELLDRPYDAIVELEYALARRPLRGDINLVLARLYEQLDDPAQAERHRRQAIAKGETIP